MTNVRDLFRRYFGHFGDTICPRWWSDSPATDDLDSVLDSLSGVDWRGRGDLFVNDDFWGLVVQATTYFGYGGGMYVAGSRDLDVASDRLRRLQDGDDPYDHVFG